jgi:hypothetical protein
MGVQRPELFIAIVPGNTALKGHQSALLRYCL